MHDITILYVIIAALFSISLGIGLSFLMKKYNLKRDDIIQGVDITQGILTFISITLQDMSFGDKNTIDKVTDIVSKSLDYIKTLQNVADKKEKIKLSTAFAVNLCNQNNIELNKERMYALSTTIMVTYNIYFALEEKNSIK